MNKLSLITATFLCCLFFTVCAYGGVPKVVATYPASGSIGVPVTSPVVVWFNENVSWATVSNDTTNNFSIQIYEDATNVQFKAITLAPQVDNSAYVLVQTSELKSNTVYRVRVAYSIRSVSTDDSMPADYIFTFTTDATPDSVPPTVNSFFPASGSINNPLDSIVTINFSEPMDPLTMTSSNIFLTDKFGGVVSTTLVYDGTTNSVTLTPLSPLSLDGVYHLNVTTGVSDISGKNMLAGLVDSVGFKTVLSDVIKPFVVSTKPFNGETSVTTDTVSILFSESMDPTTINSTTIQVKGPLPATTPVAGVLSYDSGTLRATFVATGGFAFASDFSVTITTGARDVAGNPLAAAKIIKFTTAKAAAVAPMANYSIVPPFVAGAGAKPNVMLVLDNSGSMKDSADAKPYDPDKRYYGYFDSAKMYTYSASGSNVGWTSSADAPVYTTILSGTSKLTTGNFLNWLLTSRIDALRMVMVGGVKDNDNQRIHYADQSISKSYGGVTYTLSNSAQKLVFKVGSGSSAVTYDTNVRLTSAELAAYPPEGPGLIRAFKDKMNMGVTHFNDNEGGSIAINIGQTGADFVTDVLTTEPKTRTPLAETLLEVVAYFKGGNGLYTNQNYKGPGVDPITNSCAKNFVVIVTDGEPTSDQNLPGGCSSWNPTISTAAAGLSVADYLKGTASIKGIKTLEGWTESDGRLCTELLFNGNQQMGGSWYLPAVAYYAHKTDLRSDFANKQNLDIYTVFAFDDSQNARELLKLTAKYGGFDLGGTDAPDAQNKFDKDKNSVADNYYEASNGDEMVAQLTRAFNDILAKVSSGTAASILNNSEGSGANLLQAVFYPKKVFDNAEISWTGEVQNLWYYIDPFLKNSSIRVDTVSDNKLNVKQDYIAQFFFDQTSQKTLVNLFPDANGDGLVDSATPLGPYNPDDYDNVKSLWRAGKLLWDRNVSSNPRKIFTRTGGLADSSGKLFDDSTTGLAKFSNAVESGFASKLTDEANFKNMLQAANVTEADKIVKYIHGVPETDAGGNMIDLPGYRSRLVKIGSTFGLWRLGDIVSSTPKLLANIPLNTYAAEAPTGYNDSTYDKFTKSADYQKRGMVFVGSNDGMLHAFKLGKLVELNSGSDKARLDNLDVSTGLGNEEWSFIPKNVLPYLRYTADPNYSHLYLVDGSTTIVEASIHAPSDNNNTTFPGCDSAHYWKCGKKTVTDTTTKVLDLDKTSWRTILIGSTGLGGASRNLTGNGQCYESATGTNCVKTPVDGVGYSSYYALDVTDPENPVYMWEFNGDPSANTGTNKPGGNLGYATTGPVIVREGDKSKNGRWFAVFASGPTGNISNTQFYGRSDQPLRFFVVDLGTGKLVRTIDTGIDNAFGGSLSSGTIDTDKSKPSNIGFYKDDAVYFGYTSKTTSTAWQSGGVVRVLTQESEYPDASEDAEATTLNKPWTVGSLISGIGPVTSAVTKLQDRGNGKLWLYFGTGRYFFKDSTGVDDPSSRRAIYGVKDPCYDAATNDMNNSCTNSGVTAPTTELMEQTTLGTFDAGKKGWFIQLGQAVTGTSDSERVITDPVASPNGVVFFTTFQPVTDVCSYGGSSYIWAVDYATAGTPAARAMQGKLLMQVSTGAFAEISMADAFKANSGRRLTNPVQGVPPKAQGLSILTNPKPIKKMLHIQEM